jgi:alpha,alpha-trehalase
VNDWKLAFDGMDPAREGLRETLCALGNGYVVTRGAAPESHADGTHYPGTYAAGVYNRLTTTVAGREVENESLVNLPNWLPLTFRIDGGAWFEPGAFDTLLQRWELDLRAGLLTRMLRVRDRLGRTTRLVQRRVVSMANPHLAALETTVTAENWSGLLELRAALDGTVLNDGVARYRELSRRHLRTLRTVQLDGEATLLEVETTQSRVAIALAARTRAIQTGTTVPAERETVEDSGFVAQHLAVEIAAGEAVAAEKVVALYTSRDRALADPGQAATNEIRRAPSFGAIAERHALAWEQLWRRFGFSVDEGDRTRLIVNLNLFHTLQTVSPHTADLDAGVPARGLHGEAYRGHIFWDELFVFPLVNLRNAELGRALLRYRYRRLPEARRAADDAGLAGAMFPWQSGSSGAEETQQLHLNPRSGRWNPDSSHLQRHVGAAVAYNVWQHYQATGDLEFMSTWGGELFLEIARFWASIARFNDALDRYEIVGVMGPDEYHEGYLEAAQPGLANNAYTNVMAAWVLGRALELLASIAPHRRDALCERLGITDEELERWDDVSRKLRLVFHDDGVLSQFEGYAALEELDWAAYRRRYGDISRLDRILEAEGDTPDRYRLSKQADVLMLLYLFSADELRELVERLGYSLSADAIARTVEYYLARTAHGSTLSGVVHAWVLARSDRVNSWNFFRQALESDSSDLQGGTTAEGIHLGAMAGSLDLLQRCFTGLEIRDDVLWVDPDLPPELRGLEYSLEYRGHGLRLTFDHQAVEIASGPSPARPIEVGMRDQRARLAPASSVRFATRRAPQAG